MTDGSEEVRLYVASLEARVAHLGDELAAERSRRFRLIGGLQALLALALANQMHPRSRTAELLQKALAMLGDGGPLAKVVPIRGTKADDAG